MNVDTSVLSLDPGFTNLGWAVVSIGADDEIKCSNHGIYNFCQVHPSTEQITDALFRFKEQVLLEQWGSFSHVVLEVQPFIGSTHTQLLNFSLQQIDIAIRGLLVGLGIPFFTVSPRSVRLALQTSTGNYAENKIASVVWCEERNLNFENISKDKRNHIADCVCNAYYAFSKFLGKENLLSNDAQRKSQHSDRDTIQRREKRNARGESQTSPTSRKRGRGGSSLGDDTSDQQVWKHAGQEDETRGSG